MSPISMLLVFLVVLAVVLTLYFWLSDYLTLRDTLGLVPGPRSFPLIGNSWQISAIPVTDRFEWLNNLCFEYELGMVVIWLGTKPFLNMRKPRQIEIILRSNTLISKSETYGILKPWLRNGLLTSSGNKWYVHKHALRRGFEPCMIEHYIAVLNEKTDVLIKQIEIKVQNNSKPAIVNVFPLVVKYAFDAACAIAMGKDMDTLRKSDNVYTRAIGAFCQTATERYLRPWVTSDFIFYNKKAGKKMLRAVKILHDFTENVIQNKLKELKKEEEENVGEIRNPTARKSEGKAFLDYILKRNENFQYPLSFQEMCEELDTFLFLDYNTMSAAIYWALFAIGNSPCVQAKVHEELNEVFGGGSIRPITIEQLKRLQYLDRVVKEVLRLYPSIPIIGRTLDSHAVIDDFFIPKGTAVNICVYQLHRDPEVWHEPELFDPDRFLPENILGQNSYAYLPFSCGPRKCLGENLALLQMKIVLSTILRKWRIFSLLKPSEIKMTSSFSLKPRDNKIELLFTTANNVLH